MATLHTYPFSSSIAGAADSTIHYGFNAKNRRGAQ